jgi:HAD superfamily hydrolase (TIGR01509 family)
VIEAVIFDMDGTLHDTETVFHAAWRKAAAIWDVPDIETTLADCTGRNMAGIEKYWCAKYKSPSYEEFFEARHRFFEEMTADGIPVKEGAMELLSYLKERGYKIGLATSTRRSGAEAHLRDTGMDGFFDVVMTGNDVENGKPAPDIFLRAAEGLGVAPQHCVGVEDSFNGIRGLYAAGMKPVMVPDITLPTPEIQRMLWAQCRRLTDLIPLLER